MLDSLPRPDIILTHESDLDGLVAGVLLHRLAEHLFHRRIPLAAYHYNGWKNRAMTETCAWVTDLTFEKRLDRPNWLIIDHHAKTTQPRHAHLIHDTTKSASLLCYEQCLQQELGSPELEELVRLSNIADLFLEDDPDFEKAEELAALVKLYGFWSLHRLYDGKIESLLTSPLLEISRLRREVEDPVGLEWSRSRLVPITPKVAYVPTSVGNPNRIVHQLLSDHPDGYEVLVTLNPRGAGGVTASLRSLGGQALDYARQLQGGGHPNAAGASLPQSVNNVEDALDYLKNLFSPNPGLLDSSMDMEDLLDQLDNPEYS